ncbi:acyltransferase [Tsukamurella sp. 8F]|uniref:acyltransferase family protein n=1 Tax=unclassified Tsukamurella TaxID=2633480 RepID=UPI0023B9143B|nr:MULTISPECIES: acyltransferase [unclassified Tsukamurella]MDF0529871.1 acyltransferase [Tsukamurella sp. 8J]MDF0588674.1 acyltransferase [Tsukamurella sp. 8F]
MRDRIDSLTGLRAVAAFAVCVTHAAFWAGDFTPDWHGAAFARLDAAVPVFFTLSGFLLARPWISAARAGSAAPSVRRYGAHRFWRVVPGYWLVVSVVYLIYTVRADGTHSGHGVGGYLRHMLFVQMYGPGHVKTGLTQTWSMCVEVAFYLVLPILGSWLVMASRSGFRLWRPLVGLAAIAALSLGWVAFTCGTTVLDDTSRTWPPTFGVCFAAGAALAVAGPVRLPAWGSWGCAASAVAAYALLMSGLAGPIDLSRPSAWQGAVKLALYAAFGAAMVTPLAFGSGNSVATRVLGSRIMVWLGDISYEYFLIHVMVMDVVVLDVFGWSLFRGQVWPIVAVTTAVTVPLAWALRTGVDRLHRATRARRPAAV